MAGYVQTNQTVGVPNIPAYTVNQTDTGKTLFTPITTGVGIAISLPTNAAGLHYRFINAAGLALNGTVSITSTGANIYGNIIMGPTGGVALTAVNGATTINFLTAASVIGDTIDLYSGANNWYVQATSRIAGAITAA